MNAQIIEISSIAFDNEKELTCMMVSVEDAGSEDATITMPGVIQRFCIGNVIDEMEFGTFLLIVSAHQQINVIRCSAAQVIGQISAGKMSGCLRTQFVAISHFVQSQILRNVLDELDSIAGIADGGNQQVIRDRVDFILI